MISDKIIPWNSLERWRQSLDGPVVLTNGCFDILHAGHVFYLEHARMHGTHLVVGVNSDASVRKLKGEGRPINKECDRAFVLAGLECVTAVTIFPDDSAVALIHMVMPQVWVKGGDYTLETLNKAEVNSAGFVGAAIRIIPVKAGFSTTQTIAAINGAT